MPESIGPLTPPGSIRRPESITPRAPRAEGTSGAGFGSALGGLIEQVNAAQHDAGQAIEQLIAGNGGNLHEVMLAVNKAELSFTFLMETRNKLVNAYQEIMRMQI